MCIGFLGLTKKGQDLTNPAKRTTSSISCVSKRKRCERSTKSSCAIIRNRRNRKLRLKSGNSYGNCADGSFRFDE